MSESGVPQFPTTPKLPEHSGRRSGHGDEARARISRLPRAIAESPDITRLRGEVLEVRRDAQTNESTVRIRTERGEIELRIPPEQQPPRQGQQVEVEIQPNRDPARPPEQATVRPVEERHAPPPAEQPRTEQARPDIQRPTTTPVNVEVGAPPPPRVTIDRPAAQPGAQAPQNNISAGDIIRLAPLPPEQTVTIQPFPEPEFITASVIEPAIFTAQIIAAQAQDSVLTETLNILPQTPDLVSQSLGSLAKIQTVLQQPSPLNITQSNTPVEVSYAAPPLENLTPAQILGREQPTQNPAISFLQAPVLAKTALTAFQPALITTLANLEVPASRQTAAPQIFSTRQPDLPFFDARITAVKPPLVTLVDPQQPQKPFTLRPENAPQAQPIILDNEKPGTLTGIVVGTTPEKLPVFGLFQPITGEVQFFTLQTTADNLIPGAQLQITPQAATTPAGTAADHSLLPPFSTYLAPQSWPLMEEILQVLARTAPQTAQAYSNIIPSPANPAQLTPAALFFIAAVRGMDIQGWLGDKALDALRRDGKGGIINRITSEGGLLSRIASDPVSQDWRAVNLPMFYEGEIQRIALYYKQDRQSGNGDQEQGKSTRFIFNLNLDAMGSVQLDGLFMGQRLDIILRTQQPLSQNMQADMRQTYASALRETGVTGELSFQDKPEQWVTIKVEDKQSFGVEA